MLRKEVSNKRAILILVMLSAVFLFGISTASAAPISSCQTLSAAGSFELSQSVSINTTCFNITASDIILDCQGFTISYGANGTSSSAIPAVGVLIEGQVNVTVKNCNFRDVNVSGAHGYGILLNETNSSTIFNNTIQTNGTSANYGIFAQNNANNNNISNNVVNTQGSSAANYGIYLKTTVLGNFVSSNNVTTDGGDSENIGIILEVAAFNNIIIDNIIRANGSVGGNFGIRLDRASRNTVTGNTISTNGEDSNEGINLFLAGNNTIANNTITTNGTNSGGSTGDVGIMLRVISDNNTIANNTIFAGGAGSGNDGIELSSSSYNILSNNIITTNGSSSNDGIFLSNNADNNTFTSNTISTNGTNSYGISIQTNSNNSVFTNTVLSNAIKWILTQSTTASNFTNTTFETLNGSIRLPDLVMINGSHDINFENLNISQNKAFLNSTDLTSLNVSAQITLNDITFGNPRPLVDFEDDGTFAVCAAAQCTEVSFGAGVFVFDVTSFTSYSSEQTPVAAPVGSSGGGGGASRYYYYAQSRQGAFRSQSIGLTDTSATVKLVSPGIVYTYTIQNVNASTFISAISKTNITLDLMPNNIIIDLTVFSTVKHDVDDDGFYDLAIKVLGISSNLATLKFTPIHEKVDVPLDPTPAFTGTGEEEFTTGKADTEEMAPVANFNEPEPTAEPLGERSGQQVVTIAASGFSTVWLFGLLGFIVVVGLVGGYYRKEINRWVRKLKYKQ